MILKARYVRKSRKVGIACDVCNKRIISEHLYLYGRATLSDPMNAMRTHIECIDSSESKISKALQKRKVL